MMMIEKLYMELIKILLNKELEDCISELYKSEDTVIAPSGLAALIIPFFAFLKKG